METKNTEWQDDASSPLSITKQTSPTPKDRVFNFDLFQAKKIRTTESKTEERGTTQLTSEDDQKLDRRGTTEKNPPNKRKFHMLNYITNKDLSVMQYVFENYSQGFLDKISFLLLMVEILKRNGPSLDTIIKDSVEVYDFIDIDKTLNISFSDFSSFFMTQESDFGSLSHGSLHFKPANVEDISVHSNWISKIYYLEPLDSLCLIEENQRWVKIYDARTFELKQDITLPKAVISDLCYIPSRLCLVLIASDKKLYFYTLDGAAELYLSFETPESQINIIYSQAKEALFSYGLSAKIYCWSLEKIFSKNFSKISGEKDAFSFAIDPTTPISFQKNISCILPVDELGFVATGSNDTYVRLYDTKELKRPPRVLIGHHKGIKNLAFSDEYQYLVSCSYDYDIIIWNPIVGQPLTKLTGHEALVLEIAMPEGTNYIISCDAKGCTKIWDANTLLLIEDKYPEMQNIKAVVFIPRYRRIVYAGWKMVAYEYARLLDNRYTEDYPILKALVSLKNMEIYVATTQSVSVWSLEEGIQTRSMGNITKSDITSIAIDDDQRRLYISDQSGQLKLYDALTGNLLKILTPHNKEISALLYCKDERMVISTSWDKTIRTHLETNLFDKNDLRNGVLKNLYNAHENEILCADYSERSGLLVTGSKEGKIRVWNFQTSSLDTEIRMFDSDINYLKFLDPYPILAVSDIEGNICLYSTDPHPKPYQCLVNWKNMFNLHKFSAITSMTFEIFSNKSEDIEESLLYVGDRMGYIRVFSLESLLRHSEVKRIPKSFKEKRRVSNKIEDIDFQARGIHEDRLKLLKNFSEVSGKSGNVKQILQWKAHHEAVNQITLLQSIEPLVLMTVSTDKMVKFWSLKGENITNLYQGKNINQTWKLKVKQNVLDDTQIKFLKQFKIDLETKHQTSQKKIQELIGDFTDTFEYEDMAKIENDDIFKKFADLENTVASTLGKPKATVSFIKAKKKR